jgi:sugar/nucleoside kinase (ribokinase family)
MLDAGASSLLVTMGPRGAVSVAGGGPDSAQVRSALGKAPAVEALHPTGCGDVFGATAFARLGSGAPLEAAIDAAVAAAARNATYRGASGLASHLRGSLVTP